MLGPSGARYFAMRSLHHKYNGQKSLRIEREIDHEISFMKELMGFVTSAFIAEFDSALMGFVTHAFIVEVNGALVTSHKD